MGTGVVVGNIRVPGFHPSIHHLAPIPHVKHLIRLATRCATTHPPTPFPPIRTTQKFATVARGRFELPYSFVIYIHKIYLMYMFEKLVSAIYLRCGFCWLSVVDFCSFCAVFEKKKIYIIIMLNKINFDNVRVPLKYINTLILRNSSFYQSVFKDLSYDILISTI